MEAVIILVAVGLVVLLMHLYTKRLERQRTERMQEVALTLGYSFSETEIEPISSLLKPFYLVSRGHSHRVRNCMGGAHGKADLHIFDFRFRTGSGKNMKTWEQTVFMFISDQLGLPLFTVRPENVMHKIGSVFGYRDINFPQHPLFSRKYLLQGQNEEAVREIFSSDVLSYFEMNPGLSVEGSGNCLIIYRMSRLVQSTEMQEYISQANAFYNLFRGKRWTEIHK